MNCQEYLMPKENYEAVKRHLKTLAPRNAERQQVILLSRRNFSSKHFDKMKNNSKYLVCRVFSENVSVAFFLLRVGSMKKNFFVSYGSQMLKGEMSYALLPR